MPQLAGNDVTIEVKVKGDSSGVDEVEKKLGGLRNSFENLQGIGDKMTGIGKSLTKNVTLPIAGLAAGAVVLGAQFDKTVTQMEALAKAGGIGAAEYEKLGNIALEAGKKGLFSSQQIADAMLDMVRDGMTPAQIEAGHLNAVMNLAAATGSDLASSQIALSDTMQAFGADTKDAGRYVDVFNNILNATPGELADFQESMKYVAPAAAQLGLSIEETSAAIGTLAQVGIRGSMAGTGLGQALSALYTPTDKAAEAIEALGLKMYDTNGNARPLGDVLADLSKRTSHLTEEQKNQVLNQIFTNNGLRVMLPLLKDGASGIKELTKVAGQQGTTQATVNHMTQGFAASLDRLKNSVTNAFIQFQRANESWLVPFIDGLGKLVTAFVNLPPKVQMIITIMALLIAAIGPLLIIIGTLISSIGTIGVAIGALGGAAGIATAAFTALGTVLTFISAHPIILALVAITAAVIYLATQTDLLKSKTDLVKTATDNLKNAQDAQKLSTEALANAEMALINADFRLQQSTLSLERAQLNYNNAVKQYGPTSLEAREAELQLKMARNEVEQASKNAETALKDLDVKEKEYTETSKKAKDAQDALTEATNKSETAFGRMKDAIGGALGKLGEWISKAAEHGIIGFGGVPHFAQGTNFAPGGPALVGEHGPELVNLPRGAKVTPNHSLPAGAGSGIVVNQNNYIKEEFDMTIAMREVAWKAGMR
jgi:TP901 family phage tail tape measure protein